MMRHVLLLLLGAHLANAGTHSLKYVYTAVSGDIDFPEFTAVGLVDDEQIDYFDSNIMKDVPKTEWIRQNEEADYWEQQTQILIGQHQSFKNNIQVAMKHFNQSTGLHTFQHMYGCEWDDQTNETDGFEQLGYDAEDFLSLDLKELRYISPVHQGFSTVQKLNNDRGLIESNKQYFRAQCIEWLQKYVEYGKSSLQKTVGGACECERLACVAVSPQVFLLQKSSSSSVSCHATGFYPSGVTITWMRNGQDHHEDVEVGELLPNEDGTFQRTSTLRVTPEELKKNEYSCVVEHQNKTIKEDKIKDKIRTNNVDSLPIGIIIGVGVGVVAVAVAAVHLLIVVRVTGNMVYQKKKGLKPVSGFKHFKGSHISDCCSETTTSSLLSSGSGSSPSS